MNTMPAFYFDVAALNQLAHRYGDVYRSALPFPHVVIDEFLDDAVAQRLADEFPTIDAIDWKVWGPGNTQRTTNKHIEKVGTSDETKFGAFTRHFMHELNSHTFLTFVGNLAGIQHLMPDPSYNGCGLHSTGRGGRLMIHTDANRHPNRTKNLIHQHLNLILYLNRDWKDDYGGHLELWDRDAAHCEKTIAPIFNRLVLFETGKFSFHGHPEPLACPEGIRRISLAVYYYVLLRPDDQRYEGMQPKVTWVATTPQDRAWRARQVWKERFLKLVPPIVHDIPRLFRTARR